jgi:hypothetical protein
MALVQTYGISRSHLNHRRQRYKVSIMLQKSRSPRSSMEGFCPWKEMLSITWFEQHKSLIRWEIKRDNHKLLVHRQGNQEAMPVGTDRRLSGEWLLCSCQIHLPMYSTPCIHWKDDDGFVFAALHAIDHTFGIIVTMLYLAEVRGLVVLKQLISQRTPTEHCCA